MEILEVCLTVHSLANRNGCTLMCFDLMPVTFSLLQIVASVKRRAASWNRLTVRLLNTSCPAAKSAPLSPSSHRTKTGRSASPCFHNRKQQTDRSFSVCMHDTGTISVTSNADFTQIEFQDRLEQFPRPIPRACGPGFSYPPLIPACSWFLFTF